MIARLIRVMKRDGLIGLLVRIIDLIIARFRILKHDGLSLIIVRTVAKILGVQGEMQRAKDKAWVVLKERHNYKVAYGAFKGMILSRDVWWSKYDRITQTLGIYEEHVLNRLIFFSTQGAQRFIDIGAADGYFAVGMAYSKIYSEVYAFEISSKGQEKIISNASRNLCSEAVHVFGEASITSLEKLINNETKSTVLIDIEGAEYNLLSNEMLSLLSGNYVICELHPWLIENGEELQNELLNRVSQIFNFELISRESYSPNLFPEFDDLSDEERLVAVGEGRAKNMKWLVLTPK